MQVTVYNFRTFDEKPYFETYAKELGIKIIPCADAPNLENVVLAKGSSCINIITSKMDDALIAKFAEYGVKYIVTRTIGYDHIDINACKQNQIKVGNAPYGAEGVADYTVMLILMSLRKAKRIIERTNIQDYTLPGLVGKELKDQTVGIIGAGRIGRTVIKNLSGFGCNILVSDLYEAEEVKEYASYVSLEQIFRDSDIISLHTPLTEENLHLIKDSTIEKMKDGVIIINTARGSLIDTQSLIKGIEEGKIGAAGLDVIENEFGLYYYDHKQDSLVNRELAVLRGFPNVTITHHMAFYTENYVETVVRDSLKSCKLFVEGDENPWEII